jgi:hypothetical protein
MTKSRDSHPARLRDQLKAKFSSSQLSSGARCLDSLRDHFPLLFSDRRVDMESKVVDVLSEGGHQEMHSVFHQATDEMNVA